MIFLNSAIKKFFNRNNEEYVDFFLILFFSTLLLFVIDRFLMERVPGWDHFRGDADFIGRLHILKEALLQGTLPFITSAYDFGHYFYGDPGHYISPFFPVYWLSLIASPLTVWAIRLIFLFTVGSFGTYLLVRRYTDNRIYSLAVSFFYIFFPATWTLRYGTGWDSWIYFLPIFLELTIRLSYKENKALIFFMVASFFSNTLNLSVYCLLNNLIIIGLFAFSFKFFEEKRILPSCVFAIKLTGLYVLCGAFYIVPLAFLSMQHREFTSYLCQHMGFCPGNLWTVDSLLKYYKSEILYNLNMRTTRDNVVYVPFFLNISGILAVLFANRCSFPASVTRIIKSFIFMIVVILLSPFLIMLSPFNKVFLARAQFLILPYLWILLASIGLYYFAKYFEPFFQKIKKRFLLCNPSIFKLSTFMLFVLCASIVLAIYYLYPYPSHKMNIPAMISSEALIVLMYLFALSFQGQNKGIQIPALVMIMGLFAAFGQRAYIEKKYNGSDLSHADPSLKADAEDIGLQVYKGYGGYNNDFRRFFVSVAWGNRGRNWQLIAQTALQPVEGIKTLFTWNYAVHPYVFLLQAGFNKGNVRLLTNFTSCSESVVDTPNLLDLMGVKYIISAHTPISNNASHLKFISSFYKKTDCKNLWKIESGAPNAEDNGLSGTFYLYEVKDPLKIAFFADSYTIHNRSHIYKLIINNKISHPKTVLLEEDPALSSAVNFSESKPSVQILNERDSEITIDTQSNNERMLVLSYVNWPLWRAYIDGTRTKIYRAYGGLMSIKVPEGHHVVRFKYIPWDFYIGIFISFLTLIGFSIISWHRNRKKIR